MKSVSSPISYFECRFVKFLNKVRKMRCNNEKKDEISSIFSLFRIVININGFFVQKILSIYIYIYIYICVCVCVCVCVCSLQYFSFIISVSFFIYSFYQ